MLGAYDWAFVKPMRKLYYNLTVTSISIAVAVLIGGIETLGLVSGRTGGAGWFWSAVNRLNGNFNGLGFLVIAVFVVAWFGSVLFYRLSGLDSKTESPLAG
jgi:high-affinity nickel-transport protein